MTAPPTSHRRPLRVAVLGLAAASALLGSSAAPAAAATLTGVDLSTYVRVGRHDLPEPTRANPPVTGGALLAQEASGVTYDRATDSLFIAGDGSRSVTQVSKTGALISSMNLPTGSSSQGTEFYDTEGITSIGGGEFVLTEERDRQLVKFTYVPGGTLTRAAAKTVKLGTSIGNVGLEGLTWDAKTNGFIVVKEKDPMGIFATTVDWDAGTASNGSPTTVNSTNLFDPALIGTTDLSDVFSLANVPGLAGTADADNLLIISQESGKVVEVDRAGAVKSSFTLVKDADNPKSIPDQTHEGVTMDDDGNIYVVSEEGGGDFDHPQMWVYAPSTATNAAPTAVALTGQVASLPENTSTAARVKVAGVTITDADGIGTNNLTVTGPDAAFFEVDATGLYLKAGTALSHAAKASYTVSVAVDDPTVGSTPDATTSAYTLNIAAVTAASAGTSVAVTEVAPWGSGATTTYGADWWELTNTGTTTIDLAGWKVDDDSKSSTLAVPLAGVDKLAPGESAIFIESADQAKPDLFKSFWFPGGAPAGFTIGTYTGGGIGLSTGGDEVNVYDGTGSLVTGIAFGTSTTGKSFDNTAAAGSTALPRPVVSTLSADGVNGAFVVSAETGSPGTAKIPTPIAVTEVAPWGSDNSTTYKADWFELTNLSKVTVDLTGFKVDDDSNVYTSAVALNGVSTLAPGQSAIFIEGTLATPALFTGVWFGNSIPAGFQIGTYSGSGIGLSGGGDQVNVFNGTGDRVTGVAFGAATLNYTFDNHAGAGSFKAPNPVLATLSVIDQFGAFRKSDQVGSPGVIKNPAGFLEAPKPTFPNQAAGTTGAGQWVTATNSGNAALTINRVQVREDDDASAGDFLLTSDRCTDEVLQPGETCKVQIRFAPGRENATSAATLRFTTTAPEGQTNVVLTGTSTGLPAGPKGDKGDTGAAGAKGDTGAAGAKGDTGVAGAKGDTGTAGPKGDTGAAGAKGDTGSAGAKGDNGAAGAKGDKGDKGEKGETGATGPRGLTGGLSISLTATGTNASAARLRVRLSNTSTTAVRNARIKVTLPKAYWATGSASAKFTRIAAGKSASVALPVRLAKRAKAGKYTVAVSFTANGKTVTRKLPLTIK